MLADGEGDDEKDDKKDRDKLRGFAADLAVRYYLLSWRGAGTVWSVPSAERPHQSLACATRPAEQDNRSRQG